MFADLLNRNKIFLQSHNARFCISEDGTLLSAFTPLYWGLVLDYSPNALTTFNRSVLVLSVVIRLCIQGKSENVVYT